MSKTLYLTTPLYYVNAAPHIGHSYTNIAADCLARYHRLRGEEVFLLTGTDEHGQKIAQAAAAAGKHPQEFVDGVVPQFEGLWKTLNISYDDFIRTTQERHVTAVQAMLTTLHADGKLKRAVYQGWYCTPDETFWTEGELGREPGTAGTPACPSCQRPLEQTTEEGWYLELRAAQPWLKAFVSSHPAFVRPESRYNELRSLLEQPLPEYLCITRPRNRVPWGIEVPFSREHVVYVWIDALFNYITAPGYVSEPARFAGLWPADLHVIGKDILRHHALYWPILLKALGFPDEWMPTMIFAHGWWKVGEQKMSKSMGNIVDPTVVVGRVLADQPFAADVYRYFLLREVPFGQDGAFSESALFTRLHADLANDLGNLVNRTLSMLERYCAGQIPQPGPVGCAVEDEPLQRAAVQLPGRVEAAMARIEFSVALDAVMQVVSQANRYIEATAPWKLAKEEGHLSRLHTVLYVLAEVVRIIAILLEPFMPSVSLEIWRQFGYGDQPRRWRDASQWGLTDAGQQIGKPSILFPKNQQSPPAPSPQPRAS
ncbi:MAG: methionine--tRNA ligase [Omnitrophica WOR_2 bacterium RIFCSPHIGHO2_02_FULL_67_20]|nr:MAG: methionine--tRNA ligase [Omnitrophica WOR_2 bacterium RIFCSPHIGHO2_02_FULL_67_20]